MYSFTSRVRYSEINVDGELDLFSVINYFQDCSTFHSQDAGVGIAYLNSRNRLWVMSSWQIVITRLPRLFETITINTWPYDFKGMYGYRNFTMTDEAGSLCAAANSIWVNMDTRTNRPARIIGADSDAYELEERFPMDYAPRKIEVPEFLDTREVFPVLVSHLDTNRHVNNGQYVKMAENFLPEGFSIGQIRAEYRKSAVLGDLILPRIHMGNDTCTIVLSNEEEKPYALVEFKKGVSHA